MDWGRDAVTEDKAVCCGEERAEPEGKHFNLQVNLGPNAELLVVTEKIRLQIQAAEMSFLQRVAGLSLGDRMRSLDILPR